jgi:hypothetical protein
VGGDAENSSEAQQGLFTTLPWLSGDVCHHRADVQLAEKCVAIWLTVPLALIDAGLFNYRHSLWLYGAYRFA